MEAVPKRLQKWEFASVSLKNSGKPSPVIRVESRVWRRFALGVFLGQKLHTERQLIETLIHCS